MTADRTTVQHITAMNISMRRGDLTIASPIQTPKQTEISHSLRQPPHPMRGMTNERNILSENLNGKHKPQSYDILVKKLNSREQSNA